MPELLAQQTQRLAAGECANSSPTRTTPAGPTAGGQAKAETTPRPETLALVNQVFTRLAALYPRTWESAFPSESVLALSKREMAMELARWVALPTRPVVERAMSDLKREGNTWPPTIPVLIRLLAPTPEDFGMPAVAEAWREVTAHAHEPRRHRWSHEAVRMAGNAVGWWELTHVQPSRVERLERRFAKEYQALVNRVMAGETLTERQLLEHDSRRSPAELAERAGREEAQRRAEAAGLKQRMSGREGIAALRGVLGGK
ncbi:replication protein P [Halomonas sp. YJPS3-2]|nr:replication protein P [Halomonas getboli]MCK2183535.1 replication protein P [Halomonas getboli]